MYRYVIKYCATRKSVCKNVICECSSYFRNPPATLIKTERCVIARTERSFCASVAASQRKSVLNKRQELLAGPGLEHFILESHSRDLGEKNKVDDSTESIPYLDKEAFSGRKRKVYFETYGCQMNVNDTEIAWSILKENNFEKVDRLEQSDVVLIMTCSIREGAETKIWNRLLHLNNIKKNKNHSSKKSSDKYPFKIGILGCMAERLKHKLLEKSKIVDVVCGPDAYRDLPRMLAVTDTGQPSVNVLLSLDETYADVMPVRLSRNQRSAFVHLDVQARLISFVLRFDVCRSIMRGCDNMCTYCIVPFTRGRERSRTMTSILDEIRMLSDQGVKEVTLLGQNVNSYCDKSEFRHLPSTSTAPSQLSRGFKTIYKPKLGGLRFSDLLDKASLIDPEMRIRFTSPHPKDFPDEVLHLIRERDNICNQLHMPAQSGSTAVLQNMRRGYSREAYLDLIENTRRIIPDVYLSSDFIAGFCGETEEDHRLTVDLMKRVKYNFVYCFPYSMREKTKAYHKLKDDVPEDVKARRHRELRTLFREEALLLNQAQIGQHQLVLVEGTSKKSEDDLAGRNDGNIKVIFPKQDLRSLDDDQNFSPIKPGDYIIAEITDCSSQVLKGRPLYHSSVREFNSSQFCSRIKQRGSVSQ